MVQGEGIHPTEQSVDVFSQPQEGGFPQALKPLAGTRQGFGTAF